MSVSRPSLVAFALLAALVAPRARAEEESRFSAMAQIDLSNAYIFRGIMQEKRGLIAQPWGEVYANLYSSESGFLRDITAGVGVWLSIHSQETLAANQPTSVYEADYYPLVSIDFAGGVNLLTIYYFYDSPNGAWGEAVQELNLKLSWDDSELTRLSPWVNVAVETFSTSLGSRSGSAVQLGIAPTLFEGDDFSISAGAEVGLTIDDYYEGVDAKEDTFGYANVGLGASLPINDTLSASVGFKYFFFGDDLETVNDEHGGHGVVTASLSASF
jgi:hypothetical protein